MSEKYFSVPFFMTKIMKTENIVQKYIFFHTDKV